VGHPCVYVARYLRDGSLRSRCRRSPPYQSHRAIVDIDGEPVAGSGAQYITIRGYYNGPGRVGAENEDQLLKPCRSCQGRPAKGIKSMRRGKELSEPYHRRLRARAMTVLS